MMIMMMVRMMPIATCGHYHRLHRSQVPVHWTLFSLCSWQMLIAYQSMFL